MRLLCAGDLHLGAGPDLGRAPVGRDSRLADQQRTWEAICDRAVDLRCDALLFAGDAFHHRRPAPAALMAFRAGLDILRDAGIPVVAVAGNHDTTSLAEPCAMSVFDGPGFQLARRAQIASVAPRTFMPGGTPMAVACLPWAPVVGTVQEMALALVTSAQALRAQIEGPAILLAHWSVAGASLPSDMLTNDLREVVLPATELFDQGWDAVVLGHIHVPQTVASPRMFYTGSPHVVDFGEADSAHGMWVWEDGQAMFYAIGDRPFQTLDLWVPDPGFASVLTDPAYYRGQVERAIVRIKLSCPQPVAEHIDATGIRNALMSAGAHRVYQVRVDIRRHARARAAVDEGQGPLDALAAYSDAQGLDTPTRDAMMAQTRTYLEDQ